MPKECDQHDENLSSVHFQRVLIIHHRHIIILKYRSEDERWNPFDIPTITIRLAISTEISTNPSFLSYEICENLGIA